ncbi:MAG: hypothetical protein EOO01_32850 [Chitinophagaceae bacterium]|nr:MAG: hypothetical protein EOO01_32850 [Chitinophagaceae bacterium]
MLLILSNDNIAENLPAAVFKAVCFFAVLTLCWSVWYYYATRTGKSYRNILYTSMLLTAVLFALDYSVLDNDPPDPGWRRILFESILIGSGYVTFFLGVLAVVHFLTSKIRGAFSRTPLS